jgi:transposase
MYNKMLRDDVLVGDLLGEIPLAQQIRSIKGLGTIFTAAILAGVGDLKQYAYGRQLLRRAGLNLAESTSGKEKGRLYSPSVEILRCANICILRRPNW